MQITEETPLRDLVEWMWQKFRNGEQIECPCCGQDAQVHPWSFNSKMAFALYAMYLHHLKLPGEPVHLYKKIVNPNPKRTNRSAGQLRYWGLMRRAHDQKHTEPSDGLWLITKKGIDFVNGKIKIPKKIKVYDKDLIEESEKEVSFLEALDVPFSYLEVRHGAPLT